ncbi:MAG: aminotransferase class V-fold PLP-dependent enzyme [Clostridia bacterium]|nr:aminotransferase class V-fold PLP-dependent enzyme [Clostridia bacterium]
MIYLDNSATTFPKPLCVSEEIAKCINNYCGNPGRSSHRLSIKSAEKIYETRALLAQMFNGETENVVFTYNTTYALNTAIKSLMVPNSHVLISDIEHNSVLRPIVKLSNEKFCTYDIFATNGTDEEILFSIKSKLKPNTTMLACTHVSNVGSRRLPITKIGKLCKENNIIFILDAAQSAGLYDINVKKMNISALCFPAHKSLYGPQGAAAIIYNTDKIRSTMVEGGTGINSLDENMPDFLPEMLEAGTLSTPCISGWCASLKWLKSLDLSKIRAHEEDLYLTSVKCLSENNNIILYKMNSYPGNALLFNLKNKSPSFVSNYLNNNGICVRSGFHCSPLAHKTLGTLNSGAVRISFSIFNTRNEIYEFSKLINELSSKK